MTQRLPRQLTAVAVVAGAAIRVEQYLTRRSLWLDESMLTLNLVHRGFRGLARPLDYQQGAPVGWLWLQRVLLLALGRNEYALRLLPLVSGLAAVVTVAFVARRHLGEWAGAGAAVLAAASPAAIRYSAEVKQYSSDLLIAALLLYIAPVAMSGRRRWMAWAGAGAVSVWCSHPAIVVLGATAAALAGRALWERDRRRIASVICASAVWALSWAIAYVVSLRHLSRSGYLHRYWASALGPRPLTLSAALSWLGRVGLGTFTDPGHFVPPIVGALGVLAGLVLLARAAHRERAVADIVVAVIALAVIAALADLYPLKGRLALYLLPALWLPLAGLARHVPSHRLPALGVAAAVLAGPVYGTAVLARHPFSTPDVRAALQYVANHRQPGDQVWVQWPEVPDAQFYAAVVGVTADHEIDDGGDRAGGSGGCAGADPAVAAGGGRAWAVLGYRLSRAPRDERAQILAGLSLHAAVIQEIPRHGALAVLLDFSSPPTAPARASSLECVRVGPLTSPAPS